MKDKVEQLILELIKYRYGNSAIDAVESLAASVSEMLVIQTIDQLHLNGFMFHLCEKEAIEGLFSNQAVAHFEVNARELALKNQFLEMRGIEMIKAFQQSQIPVLWLKGNPNIKWIYGCYSFRSTSDLDFLIRMEDRRAALKLVKSQGFVYPQATMDRRGVVFSEEEHMDWAHELHYSKRDEVIPLNLDLHFNLAGFPQGSIPEAIFYQDRRDWFSEVHTLTLRGEDIPVLKREDAFMQMIQHYSIHHSFCGLKWLIDLCEVMATGQADLDWAYIRSMYRKANERKMMGICFRMVEELTGIDRFGGKPWSYYWPARFAGREYGVYQSFRFEHAKGWRMKISGRLAKILMPVTAKDKWKMVEYYFFSGEAVAQRTGRKPGGNPIGNFFALVRLFFHDRGKRKT